MTRPWIVVMVFACVDIVEKEGPTYDSLELIILAPCVFEEKSAVTRILWR